MEMQTLVRRATLDDLESLLPLVRGYRTFYEQAADDAGERAFIARHLREGSSAIFIAECDGRAAGFVQLFTTWSTVRLAPVFVLEDLFVDVAFRDRGIAAGLIEAARELARESGAAAMFLETAVDNLRAQHVYEREGWGREAQFLKYNAPL